MKVMAPHMLFRTRHVSGVLWSHCLQIVAVTLHLPSLHPKMYMRGWLRHPGTLQISHADCQASLVWKEKRCDKCKHWRRGPAAEDGCHVKPDKSWWCIPSPLIRWLPSLSDSFQPSVSLLWSFLSLWPIRHALEASFWLVQNCPPYVFIFIHVSSLVPGHTIQIQIKLDEGHWFPKTPGKKNFFLSPRVEGPSGSNADGGCGFSDPGPDFIKFPEADVEVWRPG